MPSLPGSLTLPGPLIVVIILGLVILAMAATMVSALRGGRRNSGNWGAALNGARERQRRTLAKHQAHMKIPFAMGVAIRLVH